MIHTTSESNATPSPGGFSMSELELALAATLDSLNLSSADLMTVGWTPADVARSVASSSPFSDVLNRRVREHLGC